MRRWVLAILLGWAMVARAESWQVATVELPPAIGSQLPDQGYYAVMLRHVLQELGVTLNLHFLPSQRAMQEVRGGQLDAFFPMVRTPEREKDYWVSNAVYVVRIRTFVRANDPWTGGLEALRGQTICHIHAGQFFPALDAEVAAGRVKVQRVNGIGACFRMLALGRVRAVVAGEHTGWAAARAHPEGVAAFRSAGPVLSEQSVHLMFSRALTGSEERLERFNRALATLRANGTLARLEQRLVPRD